MSFLAVALLSVATTTVPTESTDATPKVEKPDLLTIEENIVEQTNHQRRRFGLSPLHIDRRLMHSARRHTAWMARNRAMQHTGAIVAENIAAGQGSSGEVVQDWMNSPGHRANILNSGYSRIGVAAYRGPDGQIYWCQQFLR